MRTLFLFLFFTVLFSLPISAQNKAPQQMEVPSSKDSTNKAILEQLVVIRGLQEEAKKDRQKIWEEMENKEAEMKEIPKNEYGAILQVEHNTRQNWLKDNWNAYGLLTYILSIIALFVSACSFYYTKKTFFSQTKTESNTSKLSREEQKALLSDMIRHFYRNYVVSLTLRVKLEAGKRSKTKDGKNKNFTGYPSEEHIKKLMVNLNDVHLNLFYKEEESHQMMNKLYVMLRNYNLELDVICDHLKSQSIDYATKSRDLDTLAFKCFYLTKEITRLIGNIWYGNEMSYVPQAKERIIKEQEKNRKDNSDETKHYGGRIKLNVPEKSYYLDTLFCEDQEKFMENLKKDVLIEAGTNTSGSPKIHIIKFPD